MGILTLVSSFRLSFLLLACLRLQPSLQISNGTPASAGEFPFVVQLLISVLNNGSHSTYANCGGSILAADVILTAAHCVHAAQENELKIHVIAGDLWRRRRWNDSAHENSHSHSQVATVSRIAIPSKYRPANLDVSEGSLDALLSPYDIALLFLDYNLSFGEYVQPVSLTGYRQLYQVPGAVGLQICGWGYETECHHPYLLRKASVPFVQEQDRCFDRLYKRASHLLGANPDLMRRMQDSSRYLLNSKEEGEDDQEGYEDVSAICVNDHNGANVCRGDSGSPLVCLVNNTKYVCGVASWALSGHCGVVGASTVFTDVGQFTDWILEHVPSLRQTDIGAINYAKTIGTKVSSHSCPNSNSNGFVILACFFILLKVSFEQMNKSLS